MSSSTSRSAFWSYIYRKTGSHRRLYTWYPRSSPRSVRAPDSCTQLTPDGYLSSSWTLCAGSVHAFWHELLLRSIFFGLESPPRTLFSLGLGSEPDSARGYGDVTIHHGGKIFMSCYVLLGILLVADAINNFFDGVCPGSMAKLLGGCTWDLAFSKDGPAGHPSSRHPACKHPKSWVAVKELDLNYHNTHTKRVHIYIYIYICICVYIYMHTHQRTWVLRYGNLVKSNPDSLHPPLNPCCAQGPDLSPYRAGYVRGSV